MGEVVSGGGSGSIDRAIASEPMLVWRRGNGGPGLGVVGVGLLAGSAGSPLTLTTKHSSTNGAPVAGPLAALGV